MSAEPEQVLEAVPPGTGLALDLGGGPGGLRAGLTARGYTYVNLDLRRRAPGEPSVVGSAESLPFADASFALVVSKDTLEHFLDPWAAVREVHRVLRPDGLFVVWVPFMHPFHGDDTYRYTPLALRHMLRGFAIERFESPLWVCSVIGFVLAELCRRGGAGRLVPAIRRGCARLDRALTWRAAHPLSFAAAYRIVARRTAVSGGADQVPRERAA